MTKNSFMLVELFSNLNNQHVVTKRKTHPVNWFCGFVTMFVVGILQAIVWGLTIVPAKINKWIMEV